jgi:hypothetical protein
VEVTGDAMVKKQECLQNLSIISGFSIDQSGISR